MDVFGTIILNGVRYHRDRPRCCRDCYFWQNHKRGCILGKENCYYLAESYRAAKSKCKDCPYKGGRPCVLLPCYRDLNREMEEKYYAKRALL